MTPSPPRLCLFNTTRAWGGGEKWHGEMAVALHRRGHDVCVVTNPRSELHAFVEREAPAVPVFDVRVGNRSFLNPLTRRRLRDLFRAERIDTLVMNLPADLKVAGPAAKAAGVRRILYRRGSAIPVRGTRFNRHLYRNVLTGVIANSEATKRCILADDPDLVPASKIAVLYNGLDHEAFDAQPATPLRVRRPGELVIGNVARFEAQKGHTLLLEAVAALVTRGFDVHLMLAGKGRLENDVRVLARSLGIERRVTFAGFLEQVRPFLNSLDVFALSSHWEGFGYALVEAMLAERPVIAFDLSSNPEVVGLDDAAGWLIGENTPGAMADALERFAHLDADARRAMGEAGRARVLERFTHRRAVEELEAHLELPLAGGPSAL
jgi:glycosyltransferase involved in cell wall biosynthesis